jgi:hypothetical protein
MKKQIILLVSFILLTSCMSIGAATSGIPQLDPAYKIETLRESPKNTPPCWSYVSFLGAGYLKAKEDKKAATELREPNYETIPPGGLIIVQVNANTIGSADGEDYTFIVLDANGVEVAREHGNDSIPSHKTSNKKTMWYGVHAVVLTQENPFPLRIRIVNSIYPDDYYEYSIVPVSKQEETATPSVP